MASKFKFRLATVERIRKQQRDEHRRTVAEAVRHVKAAESEVESLTREMSSAVERKRGLQRSEKLDMAVLRYYQLHQGFTDWRIAQARSLLDALTVELEARQAKLATASTRLRVIEKLRQKHWLRHARQLARVEQSAADDAAVQGFMSKARESGEEKELVLR